MYGLSPHFRITHPFHPRTGEELRILEYRRSWGHEQVVGIDSNDRILSVPLAWTDAGGAPDPFIALSAGRSFFRLEDLLRLADLIHRLGGSAGAPVAPSSPLPVKEILPDV